MAKRQEAEPEPWGRSRLRPRSTPLVSRREPAQPSKDGLPARSLRLKSTVQYRPGPRSNTASKPWRVIPANAEDVMPHLDGASLDFTLCLQACWNRVQQRIGRVTELVRKTQGALKSPPPALSWPLEHCGSWRWLFWRLFLLLFVLSLAIPFTVGFTLFTVRRVMLTMHDPVHLPMHEPLVDLAMLSW